MGSDFVAQGIGEKIHDNKHQLPILQIIGAGPIINMKLRWGDSPEINVRVMLDPGANVPVLLQLLVGEHQVPVVLWEKAEIITGYDGTKGKGAGSAYTFAYTQSLADHYTRKVLRYPHYKMIIIF